MSAITISELGKSNTVFSQEIQKAKEGKKEVTNGQYRWIGVVGFIIVSCLALQNGLYGWGQGAMIVGMVVLAIMYFAGDWALSSITGMFAPQWASWILAGIAVVGLFLLSLTAGVSFMLSQQHAKDVQTSRVGELEEELAVNREKFKEYGKTITATRIRAIQAELEAEKVRVGANHASSNAIYGYIAKLWGWSYESVSLLIRSIWILIFIFTAMALSALRGMLWCPAREKAFCKALEKKFKEENRQVKRELELQAERQRVAQEMQALISESYGLPQTQEAVGEREQVGKAQLSIEPSRTAMEKQKSKKVGPRKNAKLRDVDPRTKRPPYKLVKTKVIEGEIKPRVRALTALGMGAEEASKYLKRMLGEGILEKPGRDYRLVAQ